MPHPPHGRLPYARRPAAAEALDRRGEITFSKHTQYAIPTIHASGQRLPVRADSLAGPILVEISDAQQQVTVPVLYKVAGSALLPGSVRPQQEGPASLRCPVAWTKNGATSFLVTAWLVPLSVFGKITLPAGTAAIQLSRRAGRRGLAWADYDVQPLSDDPGQLLGWFDYRPSPEDSLRRVFWIRTSGGAWLEWPDLDFAPGGASGLQRGQAVRLALGLRNQQPVASRLAAAETPPCDVDSAHLGTQSNAADNRPSPAADRIEHGASARPRFDILECTVLSWKNGITILESGDLIFKISEKRQQLQTGTTVRLKIKYAAQGHSHEIIAPASASPSPREPPPCDAPQPHDADSATESAAGEDSRQAARNADADQRELLGISGRLVFRPSPENVLPCVEVELRGYSQTLVVYPDRLFSPIAFDLSSPAGCEVAVTLDILSNNIKAHSLRSTGEPPAQLLGFRRHKEVLIGPWLIPLNWFQRVAISPNAVVLLLLARQPELGWAGYEVQDADSELSEVEGWFQFRDHTRPVPEREYSMLLRNGSLVSWHKWSFAQNDFPVLHQGDAVRGQLVLQRDKPTITGLRRLSMTAESATAPNEPPPNPPPLMAKLRTLATAKNHEQRCLQLGDLLLDADPDAIREAVRTSQDHVPVEIEMLGGARPPRVHYLRTAPDGQLVRKNPRQDMLWEYLRGPDGATSGPIEQALRLGLWQPQVPPGGGTRIAESELATVAIEFAQGVPSAGRSRQLSRLISAFFRQVGQHSKQQRVPESILRYRSQLLATHMLAGEVQVGAAGDPAMVDETKDPVARELIRGMRSSEFPSALKFFNPEDSRGRLIWKFFYLLGQQGYRFANTKQLILQPGLYTLTVRLVSSTGRDQTSAATSSDLRLTILFGWAVQSPQGVQDLLRQNQGEAGQLPQLLIACLTDRSTNQESLEIPLADCEAQAKVAAAAYGELRADLTGEELRGWLTEAQEYCESLPNPIGLFPDVGSDLKPPQLVTRPAVISGLEQMLRGLGRPIAIYAMRKVGKTATAVLLSSAFNYRMGTPPNLSRIFAQCGPNGDKLLEAWRAVLRPMPSANSTKTRSLLVLDEFDTFCRRLRRYHIDPLPFLFDLEEAARRSAILCLGFDPDAFSALCPESNPLQNLQTYRLRYFNKAESGELVERIAGVLAVEREATESIWELAGGHPVIMKELLRLAIHTQFGSAATTRIPRRARIRFPDSLRAELLTRQGTAARTKVLESIWLTRARPGDEVEAPSIGDGWRLIDWLAIHLPKAAPFSELLAKAEELPPPLCKDPALLLEQVLDWGLIRKDEGDMHMFAIPLLRAHIRISQGMKAE